MMHGLITATFDERRPVPDASAQTGRRHDVLAAATYVLGAFLPTLLVNVPMNEALALASLPRETESASQLWSAYSTRWTWWNSLRTVFSAASLVLVGISIFVCGWQTAGRKTS